MKGGTCSDSEGSQIISHINRNITVIFLCVSIMIYRLKVLEVLNVIFLETSHTSLQRVCLFIPRHQITLIDPVFSLRPHTRLISAASLFGSQGGWGYRDSN